MESHMGSENFIPKDHYAIVTNQIIEALENGGLPPWRKPWDSSKSSFFSPCNATTGRCYRGINVLLLGMSPLSYETGDPRWCSYQQAHHNGWRVKKGEKATTVYFFKVIENENQKTNDDIGIDDDEKAVRAVLRSYPVFHASQIDGIKASVAPKLEEAPWRVPEAVEIISNSAIIKHGGDRAFFNLHTDHIQIPVKNAFSNEQMYSSTLLHELAHWTGAKSRLNRDFSGRFGSHAYALEELTADLGGVMVAAQLGINPDIENHASYAESWLRALREDSSKRVIFKCSAAAQKIADHLLGLHPLYAVRAAAQAADGGTRLVQPTNTPTSIGYQPPDTARRRGSGPIQVAAALPAHMRRSLGIDKPPTPAPETLPTHAPTPDEPSCGPRFR